MEPTAMEYHMISDKESSYDWRRQGEEVVDVIMEAADIEEEVANDVQEILGKRFSDCESAEMGLETEFAAESHYKLKNT